MCAYDAKERNLKDGKITIKDNASETCELVLDNGGLKFTERPREHKMVNDRGTKDHWRDGAESPVDVSFEMSYSTLMSDTGASETVTPHEALTNSGAANGVWATKSGTDTWALDLEFEVANPVSGGKKEVITFSQFVVDSIDLAEGDDGDTLSVSGRAKSFSVAREAA
jgi:hypothetical protein